MCHLWLRRNSVHTYLIKKLIGIINIEVWLLWGYWEMVPLAQAPVSSWWTPAVMIAVRCSRNQWFTGGVQSRTQQVYHGYRGWWASNLLLYTDEYVCNTDQTSFSTSQNSISWKNEKKLGFRHRPKFSSPGSLDYELYLFEEAIWSFGESVSSSVMCRTFWLHRGRIKIKHTL